MLTDISLKNFKCFRDINLSMKPLTVLTGINGMGKSSLIQALLLLRQSGGYSMRELVLNGTLVSLGYGQDLLYESAQEDSNIVISLREETNCVWEFTFAYSQDGRKLQCVNKTNSDRKQSVLWGKDFFYLSSERCGPRKSFSLFSDNSFNLIGNAGEFCESLLNEHGEVKCDSLRCYEGTSERGLNAQTEAWISAIGKRTRIHLETSRNTDSIGLTFSFINGDTWSNKYRASNVGFGLTYVLPVLVSCLLIKKGGLVIIENPESHLHPKGQAVLGTFLARAANSGVQIIIETHSDHILNGIRIATKKKYIRGEDTVFHFFGHDEADNCSLVESLIIDNDGRLDKWPEGFFDEWEKSLLELL